MKGKQRKEYAVTERKQRKVTSTPSTAVVYSFPLSVVLTSVSLGEIGGALFNTPWQFSGCALIGALKQKTKHSQSSHFIVLFVNFANSNTAGATKGRKTTGRGTLVGVSQPVVKGHSSQDLLLQQFQLSGSGYVSKPGNVNTVESAQP